MEYGAVSHKELHKIELLTFMHIYASCSVFVNTA